VQLLLPDWTHHQGTFKEGHAVLIDDAGRIAAVGPAKEVRAQPEAAKAREVRMADRALLPGTVSAHSHCFQVLLRGASDHPPSFREWVRGHLYPLVERLDETSLETAALLCFSQMARAGITTVGEFHYIHNAQDYAPRSLDMARIVIGAARRVGLRIAFVRAIYDVQERHGQGRFAEPPADAVKNIKALREATKDDPFVSVLPAPHSLHGATKDAILAGAALAKELGTRWHIHIAEQKGDVDYARRNHGATPVQVLDQWGVLDERTVLVHGIWLQPDERKLMVDRKAALISNPSTNMALGDGIAPLTELTQLEATVALGTDLNAAPNIFFEMRTAEWLQRVLHLRMGMIPTAGRDGATPEPGRLLAMGTRHGADVLGVEAGAIEPGKWADLVAVDTTDASLLPAGTLGGSALLSAVTGSMVAETAVREVIVGGRLIVRDGQVAGVPHAELAARVREAPALAQARALRA
jgi:5-methylthioadenosine/S-adenosylhomocysteine deaminase